MGGVECLGILRCAQDDSKGKSNRTGKDKKRQQRLMPVSAVQGVPDQDEGEGCDDDRRGPGDHVEPVLVGVFAH
jgi:hypothetical protein